MCNKKMLLIFVVLLLGFVGSALAADVDWTNGGGDRVWDNASNWSAGVPGVNDKAAIRAGAIPGPIIDSSTAAAVNVVVLGDWSSVGDTLDINGGSLTTNGWFIVSYGSACEATFNVNGGATTVGSHLDIGFAGIGHMNMTGGTVDVPNGAFGIGTNDGTGDVFLHGGTVSCDSFTMSSGCLLDVTAGTLIINGDERTTINDYAANGWITAYGGAGMLHVDYNVTNPSKTTVTATIPTGPPAKATNPTPQDGATNYSTIPTLSWTPGTDTMTHDVYFGTNNPPAFQDNQTEATFSPAELNEGTVYYWRIDEKNDYGTTTGDVWSFTTTVTTTYSLIGKVMCGYQAWFNCPGDGTPMGWRHWGETNEFTPEACTVDWWPDMTEYTADEKFLADAFYDGTDHYVFSSHNLATVRRHFKWMQDYGIDGAYLQRFAAAVTPGSDSFNDRNDKLDYCKDAANMYGRKYAVMYDLSGLDSGTEIQTVVDDWKFLVDSGRIPRAQAHDPAYMFHNSKPVVAVWGFAKNRPYEGQESRDLIDFLKNDATYGGNTVMIGVDKDWRINTDPYFEQTRDLADIISPWVVGAYTSTSGAYNWANTKGLPDKQWCDANGKDFLPVMFPGFSWYNMGKGPFNQIPRMGGQFFWDQVYADITTVGATMLYIAMFDEVDEGTAIFKLSNTPPQVSPAQFLTLDIDGYDVPGDEYLWLAGQAGKALRGEIQVNATRPDRSEVCGNQTCGSTENQCNCPDDCGTPPSTESNCTDGIDEDCDTYTDCDDSDCTSDPACIVTYCGDGTCDPDEDQCNCPDDCGTPPSAESSCTDGIDNDCDADTDCDDADCSSDLGCTCGNGICDQGEDCNTCSADCISRTSPPKFAYCCGDGVCEGAEDSIICAIDCGVPAICGDGTCDAGEDKCSCPDDCGEPLSAETNCTDGMDEDCDGDTDCGDSDCDGDPACPSCKVKGEPCATNEECCSNQCHPVKGTCK